MESQNLHLIFRCLQITVIFYASFSSFWASAQNAPSCQDAQRWAQDVVRYIRETITEHDHNVYFTNLRAEMRRCEITEQSLGFNRRANLSQLERLNNQYSLDLAEDRVRRLSEYRSNSEDLATIRRLRPRGRSGTLTEAELNRFSQRGDRSEERERASCNQVDLRGPRLGPPRDQDSIGWCYAFSTADLLSYRLGVRVSAADLAVNYNKNHKQPGLLSRAVDWTFRRDSSQNIPEGGLPADTIRSAIQAGGACREASFRSDDNGYNNLKNTMRQLARGYASNPDQCLTAGRATFPGIPTEELRSILSVTGGMPAVENLIARACQPRIPLDGIEVKSMNIRRNTVRQITDQIDDQLNQRQPLEVTYTTGCIEASDCEGRSGLHSSLVVARRFNSNTRLCEYLIRNSWGRSCLGQGNGMDCEEGHVWVSKPQLHQGLYGITYLK